VSGSTWAIMAFLSLALVLPVAALRGRGLRFEQGWKMAAIWFGVFALVAMMFGWIGM